MSCIKEHLNDIIGVINSEILKIEEEENSIDFDNRFLEIVKDFAEKHNVDIELLIHTYINTTVTF